MPKQFAFHDDARRKLKQGSDTLASTVATTLGPKGRNVALDKKFGIPTITHDGVTVAKEIALADPYENMGAQLLKEAATRTNDIAGDGTATATVLAQIMVHEGLLRVAAGVNPILVKQGMERGQQALSQALREMAVSIDSKEEIAFVASISAQDEEIGRLIAEVMGKVGKDGVITVEESPRLEFETEYVEGMQFDRGYISPYFVTDSETMEAVVEDAYILIHDKKISSAQDIVPILEKLVQVGRKNLVVIAEDVDGEALATLVLNKLRGMINALAVKAPGFGDRRKAVLQDIAVLTGGQVITEEMGRKLESIQVSDLGRAAKIVATKDDTLIVDGQGSESDIRVRVKQIKVEIDRSTSDYDREKLQERLAKLAGGVAIIRVGAATEVELKEKKHRVEDALSATRAAVEEGIVPGGGVALLNLLPLLDQVVVVSDDQAAGLGILRRALLAPMHRLAENAGVNGDVIIQNVRRIQEEKDNQLVGYNVLSGEYVDMIKAGIIDPAKVTRGALETATSIAGMLLSIDALVSDVPSGGLTAVPTYRSVLPPIPLPAFPALSVQTSPVAVLPATETLPVVEEMAEAYAVARLEDLPAPDTVYVDQPFALVAGITTEVPVGVDDAVPIQLPPDKVDYALEIAVYASGMEVDPDHYHFTYHRGEETLFVFTLTPRAPGRREVRVVFHYEQLWLTDVRFILDVVPTLEAIPAR